MTRKAPKGTVTRIYHLMLVVTTTGEVPGMGDIVRDVVADAADMVGDAISDALPLTPDESEDPFLWDVRLRLVDLA